MKSPLPLSRILRSRRGALLGALLAAAHVLWQGAFSPAAAEAGRRPMALAPPAAQDFAPLAEPAGAGRSLPLTIAAPLPSPPTEIEWIELGLRSDLIERFHRSAAADPLVDIGNAILRGPESLVDGALRLVAGLFPQPDAFPVPGEGSRGITARLLEVQLGAGEGRVFSTLLAAWVEREHRLLSLLYETDLDTGGVEDLDVHELLRDQGKILWDAVRQTYRSNYRFRGEDRIRDDAFRLADWRGVDYAVVPPLVAGYLWWRGLEKRISLGGTWLLISIEPLSDWMSGNDDLVAGFSLEWGIEGFPVGLIVSAGRYDGDEQLDFIGIGTSVAMVRRALGGRLEY